MSGPPPLSLWSATGPDPSPAPRQLDGDLAVDVAIVGAGYTGLWTALSLLEADPGVRVVVVDRERVGFGASGRNGGWCSALLPISLTALERRHGRSGDDRLATGDDDTVDHIGRFAAESAAAGHDAHFHKGGTLTMARNAAQYGRLEASVAEARRFGFGEDDLRLLDSDRRRLGSRAVNLLGATVHSALRCRPPVAARRRRSPRPPSGPAHASSKE